MRAPAPIPKATLPLLRDALRSHSIAEVPEDYGVDTRKARDAAVIVPVRVNPTDSLEVLATVRTRHLGEHAGEVGFPGGKREPHDRSLLATALRELEEELGVAASVVEPLGALSSVPVITGRFRIHPYVAWVPADARIHADAREVERVVPIEIDPWLRGERVIHAVEHTWHGVRLTAPHFALDRCILYGASAYIFHELLRVLAEAMAIAMPDMVLQHEAPWGDRYREYE